MIISDEAAIIIIGILVLCVVLMAGLAVVGLIFLLRGRRIVGGVMIAAVLAFAFGPFLVSQARIAMARPSQMALSYWPDPLELEGQRVLFVGLSPDPCETLCYLMLASGMVEEVYSLSLASYDSDNLMGDPLNAIRARAPVLVSRLGPPDGDTGGWRFPGSEPMEGFPEVDLVILDNGAPDIIQVDPDWFGLTEAQARRLSYGSLVYAGWPDPGSTPTPVVRMLSFWHDVSPIAFWWVDTDITDVPPIREHLARWTDWICAAAPTPQEATDQSPCVDR